MEIRKQFDPALYKASDAKAKKAMLKWLEPFNFTTVDTTERMGYDVVCKAVVEKKHLYEVEIKYGWKDEWPDAWKEIRIPHRKRRLIKRWLNSSPDDPFTFVVFRSDCQKAWHIDANVLLTCDVREFANSKVGRGELFYHIPVEKATLHDMSC
jgi:hypothetical protein|tara:strand:- start:599 stop:1057 length:459 start_codon:yes stop_codon:yes gene_type:complete